MTWQAVAVLLAAIGGQTFWIARALADVKTEIRDVRTDLGGRVDRVDERLARAEATVIKDHGERIARLEERTTRGEA